MSMSMAPAPAPASETPQSSQVVGSSLSQRCAAGEELGGALGALVWAGRAQKLCSDGWPEGGLADGVAAPWVRCWRAGSAEASPGERAGLWLSGWCCSCRCAPYSKSRVCSVSCSCQLSCPRMHGRGHTVHSRLRGAVVPESLPGPTGQGCRRKSSGDVAAESGVEAAGAVRSCWRAEG